MHFEEKYHCRFNRLSNIAVPTMNMPCLNANTTVETPLLHEQHLLNVPSVSTAQNYKQPISYSFSSGATKGSELAHQVKENIKNLKEAGFKVVATVCDQGTNNRQAIKYLIDETTGDYLRRGGCPKDNIFVVDGNEIVPLYDPPHLLKGIRNNLLTKNLVYEMDGQQKIAKWQHLQQLHGEILATKV
ncbi:uncharacterized protein LOC125490993 [Plutella xylostella]|uniref:uncharacterized protein LOC125490993 n=1 Tax=Plutella xylostella TaxID=51655 RepID=UPI00203220E6|nr:uncharacterized protein LOC125490993 [Plutella xylostella]